MLGPAFYIYILWYARGEFYQITLSVLQLYNIVLHLIPCFVEHDFRKQTPNQPNWIITICFHSYWPKPVVPPNDVVMVIKIGYFESG